MLEDIARIAVSRTALPRRGVRRTVSPVAVVVVSVAPRQIHLLPPFLRSLAQSRGAGHVPIAPKTLAVLITVEDAEGLTALETVALDCPFPLRVCAGLKDIIDAIHCATLWARILGATGAPVLLTDVARPVRPRWAYEVLAALRDGADLVVRRRTLLGGLFGRPVPPLALSRQAQSGLLRLSGSRRNIRSERLVAMLPGRVSAVRC
jgi:hypothetical protein